MSYMRCGYPLEYFISGTSESYVYVGSSDGKDYVEDYGDTYDDNCSFIELIGNIVYSETKDQEYADKIVKILAGKMGVADKLRGEKATCEQLRSEYEMNRKFKQDNKFIEYDNMMFELQHDPELKKAYDEHVILSKKIYDIIEKDGWMGDLGSIKKEE